MPFIIGKRVKQTACLDSTLQTYGCVAMRLYCKNAEIIKQNPHIPCSVAEQGMCGFCFFY